MNKFFNIAIAVAVSAFLATNFYLLFSEKSVIPKSLYVQEYERMTAKDYREKLPKETFVAPLETYTMYVGEEEAVNSWLVSEGERVTVGQELALLNTERAQHAREIWEAEREALLEQEIELNTMIKDLASARSKTPKNGSSDVNRKDGITEVQGKTTIEIGLEVGFTVDVTQEGSYSQAIAAIEQQLAEVTRQLTVVEAQLAQDASRPALISPAEGVVSDVTRHGSTLSVDIYSEQKVLVTYVKDEQWKAVEEGQKVVIKGMEKKAEGTVLSVSSIPAKENELLNVYKDFDLTEAKNPLAYYEVRILPEEELEELPFANHVQAVITTDEALGVAAIKDQWLVDLEKKAKGAAILDASGKPAVVSVVTPFSAKDYAVITEGVQPGDIVLHTSFLKEDEETPQLLLSFPMHMPAKKDWKAYGWRNYLEAMILK